MPIRTDTGGGENVVVAAAALRYMRLLLADRASLRGHPALINLAAFGAGRLGSGSTVSQFTLFGLDGYDLLATTANEVSALSETALTTAARTCTVARRGLRRDYSDLMASVDPSGTINSPRLAIDGFMAAQMTLTNLIAQQADDFATQVGTTGVDMDHDVFLEAKAALIEALVPGPYLCVLHPNHFSRWMIDLEARAGVTQWRAATEQMQMLRGPGFQGTYDGVDVFTSSKCPASGGDKVSMMFGQGALGYAEQEVVLPESAFVLLQEGPIAVCEARTEGSATTSVMTHYYVGVTEIEDSRGVGILAVS